MTQTPRPPDSSSQPLQYATPPIGTDTQAQLLAIDSLHVLGPILAVLGLGFGSLVGILTLSGGLPGDRLSTILISFVPVSFGLMGVAYIICARKISHGSRTAAIVALSLAALHEFLAILALVPLLLTPFIAHNPVLKLVSAAALAIDALIVFRFAQLIRYLFRYLRPTPTTSPSSPSP